MSHWAEYLKERLSVDSIETEAGFATYEDRDDKTVFICDFFVDKNHRKSGAGSAIFEKLLKHADGRTIEANIWLHYFGAEEMLKIALTRGFKIKAANERSILISKEGSHGL